MVKWSPAHWIECFTWNYVLYTVALWILFHVLIKLNKNCDNCHLLRRTFEAASLSWRASSRSLPLTKPKETYIDTFQKHLLLQIVQQEWTVVVNLPFLVGQSHDSQLSGTEPHRASGSYPVWKQKWAFLKIYQEK